MPRITPNLWFDTDGHEAAEFYVSVFPNSKITNVTHYGETGPRPAGTVLTVDFVLDGQECTAINGGPQFTFDEAISLLINCADQDEVDYYWTTLSEGGEEGPCGWLKDRYGLSWQVCPVGLAELLNGPDQGRAGRAMRAVLGMKKIDVAALYAAADQVSSPMPPRVVGADGDDALRSARRAVQSAWDASLPISARQTVVVSPTLRAPRTDELEQLRQIERAAGVRFAEIGFEQVAAAQPASVETLAEYVLDGRAWLIADEGDVPIGYTVVDVVDGLAHLEQLSVLPDRGRQGLGAALLEHVCDWATRQQFEGVTLTTFTKVPWNAPFYAKHGFRVMNDSEIGPELRDLRALEAAHGLDPTQRVCMRRDV